MKRPLQVVILAFAITWLTNTHAEPNMPALHSLAVKQNSIVFEVTSYGCSRDTDFELRVDDGPGISLIRKRPDRCKRAPMVIQIKRSLKASGLSLQTPFAIRNAFSAPPVKHKTGSKKYSPKTGAWLK
jgi:hypothetical protein